MKRSLIAILLSLAASLSWAAVDANKANETELGSISGIGTAIGSTIVQQRKSAPFKDWSDFIARVPGIGDKRAARLSAQGLTVNGAPYKAAAPASAGSTKQARK